MVSVGYLCTQKISLDGAETLANFLRYWLFKSGPLTSNVAEAGLFFNTRDGLAVPDLQLLFGPAYYRGHGLVRRKEHCFGFRSHVDYSGEPREHFACVLRIRWMRRRFAPIIFRPKRTCAR